MPGCCNVAEFVSYLALSPSTGIGAAGDLGGGGDGGVGTGGLVVLVLIRGDCLTPRTNLGLVVVGRVLIRVLVIWKDENVLKLYCSLNG